MKAWRKTFFGELAEVALIAIVLFFVARVAIQNFRVNGYSMQPTLQNNEFILVDKLSYHFTSPQRGDIIVFRYPGNPSEDFIKRVIGIPGDRITIHNGAVYVDGTRLKENYIEAPPDYTMWKIPNTDSDVVPKGYYFVLGDNRNDSADSHYWGLLPRSDIIGRALIAYWPPQDFGILGHPTIAVAHSSARS
jgi:signal peptidase I